MRLNLLIYVYESHNFQQRVCENCSVHVIKPFEKIRDKFVFNFARTIKNPEQVKVQYRFSGVGVGAGTTNRTSGGTGGVGSPNLMVKGLTRVGRGYGWKAMR